MSNTSLRDQISNYVDDAPPITFAEIATRAATHSATPGRPRRQWPRLRPTWIRVTIATGVAAAAATALVVSQVGGTATTPPAASHKAQHAVVLDAKAVRQIVAASQVAMAVSGRVALSERSIYRDTDGSLSSDSLISQIAFDRGNWNDQGVYYPIRGLSDNKPETYIDRVVDGQFYGYYPGQQSYPGGSHTPTWVHAISKSAAQSMQIPDPRRLVTELSPAAGLVPAGTATVNGVPVRGLRATEPGSVPVQALASLANGAPAQGVTALELWVDPADVVLKAQFTLIDSSGNKYEVTATFSDLGQAQHITAPSSAVPTTAAG